jgi:hypothetical protein
MKIPLLALPFWFVAFLFITWPITFIGFARRETPVTKLFAWVVVAIFGFPPCALMIYWLSRFYHPLPHWVPLAAPILWIMGFWIHKWRLDRGGGSFI